jgi:hypothetical protein
MYQKIIYIFVYLIISICDIMIIKFCGLCLQLKSDKFQILSAKLKLHFIWISGFEVK